MAEIMGIWTNPNKLAIFSELKTLKSIERPTVIKSIAEAREHGDLSENAEYHAAKEKQSFIEGRIADLQNKISRAEVIITKKLKNTPKFHFCCFENYPKITQQLH